MSKGDILDITDSLWNEKILKSELPVMVMFYSPTCSHCHNIEPYFDEYSKDFKDRVVFAKINIMENPKVSRQYAVMGTPTFKFFCKGHPVIELVGAVYPYILKKNIEEALQKGPDCINKTSWIDYSINGYG